MRSDRRRRALRAWDAEGRYPDGPTARKNLVADVATWLQLNVTKPTIEELSCAGMNFDHRRDDGQYATFRTQIHCYGEWIGAAYGEPDRDKSVAAWQKVFGPDFKAPVTAAAFRESMAKAAPRAVERAPREEDMRYRSLHTSA